MGQLISVIQEIFYKNVLLRFTLFQGSLVFCKMKIKEEGESLAQ